MCRWPLEHKHTALSFIENLFKCMCIYLPSIILDVVPLPPGPTTVPPDGTAPDQGLTTDNGEQQWLVGKGSWGLEGHCNKCSSLLLAVEGTDLHKPDSWCSLKDWPYKIVYISDNTNLDIRRWQCVVWLISTIPNRAMCLVTTSQY